MIKTSYDSKDAIPEGFASLYTEKDGKFVLTGVDGMKTQQDVDNVKTALGKERDLRKTAEATVTTYGGIEAEGLRDSLDELARLRTTKGKVDDSSIEGIVAERLKLDKEKHQRELEAVQTKYDGLESKNTVLVNGINKGKIESALRDASAGKVNETAINDVLFRSSMFEVSEDGAVLTRDGVGVMPGQEPQQWLETELKANTHWQKTSKGGGAKPPGGAPRTSKDGESDSYSEMIGEQCEFQTSN